MADTIEGQAPDGTQAKPTPETKATETPISPEAKVAKDKAEADAKLR